MIEQQVFRDRQAAGRAGGLRLDLVDGRGIGTQYIIGQTHWRKLQVFRIEFQAGRSADEYHGRGGDCLVTSSPPPMTTKEQRWLRIIPVALVMYTISYVDRTNVSLALDPAKSSMLRDLVMDDRM